MSKGRLLIPNQLLQKFPSIDVEPDIMVLCQMIPQLDKFQSTLIKFRNSPKNNLIIKSHILSSFPYIRVYTCVLGHDAKIELLSGIFNSKK